jgi:hypothetical protein
MGELNKLMKKHLGIRLSVHDHMGGLCVLNNGLKISRQHLQSLNMRGGDEVWYIFASNPSLVSSAEITHHKFPSIYYQFHRILIYGC